MPKIQEHIEEEGGRRLCMYFCPGCNIIHTFNPKAHVYNEDPNNPTISPSLLLNNPQNYKTCHSFIEEGKIRFLEDCWHDLKGQTVELPIEWESK